MYKHTMQILQRLQTDLRQNTRSNLNINEVSDLSNNCTQDIDESAVTSLISETLPIQNTATSLSNINLPSPIKIIGRRSIASNNIIIKKKPTIHEFDLNLIY